MSDKIYARICEQRDRYESAFGFLQSLANGAPVTIKALAKQFNITDDIIRRWIKENRQYTKLRIEKDIVFCMEEV